MEPNIVASTVFWVVRTVLLVFGEKGRVVSGRLAPLFGRLNLSVEPQIESRFWGENPPYDLVRVLVVNGGGRNAGQVRCDIRWNRAGRAMPERGDTHAAWVETWASDMASFSGPPIEALTLSSNGTPGCLPIIVKYPGERDAYIPTRSNFLSAAQPRWTNTNFVLRPGSYDAVLTFRSEGNKTGTVRLRVVNEGETGTVRLDPAPKSTL